MPSANVSTSAVACFSLKSACSRSRVAALRVSNVTAMPWSSHPTIPAIPCAGTSATVIDVPIGRDASTRDSVFAMTDWQFAVGACFAIG